MTDDAQEQMVRAYPITAGAHGFLPRVFNDQIEVFGNFQLHEYKNIQEGKNFHFYGPTNKPERVLNAGDVFVLPTYREGFGSSVLEAACIGLPSICTDAYGVLDAYIDGETGLQCKVGDADSLYQCMKKVHENPELCMMMGRKSRERALKEFNVKPISEAWFKFYKNILG